MPPSAVTLSVALWLGAVLAGLAETLVRLGHCQEHDVTRALARQFGLPLRLDLEDDAIQDKLIEQLPIGYARGNLVLPWRLDRRQGKTSGRSAACFIRSRTASRLTRRAAFGCRPKWRSWRRWTAM